MQPEPISQSAVETALAYVDFLPLPGTRFSDVANPMRKHCGQHENLDKAAGRILAARVRELQSEFHTEQLKHQGWHLIAGRAVDELGRQKRCAGYWSACDCRSCNIIRDYNTLKGAL